MSPKRYEYGQKNILAKQNFRGKIFYEKICYKCHKVFLSEKYFTMACPVNSCQVTVSRRLKNKVPFYPLEGVPKYPKKKIDFVKYGMEAKKERKLTE